MAVGTSPLPHRQLSPRVDRAATRR
jgi:hypothetical protein